MYDTKNNIQNNKMRLCKLPFIMRNSALPVLNWWSPCLPLFFNSPLSPPGQLLTWNLCTLALCIFTTNVFNDYVLSIFHSIETELCYLYRYIGRQMDRYAVRFTACDKNSFSVLYTSFFFLSLFVGQIISISLHL